MSIFSLLLPTLLLLWPLCINSCCYAAATAPQCWCCHPCLAGSIDMLLPVNCNWNQATDIVMPPQLCLNWKDIDWRLFFYSASSCGHNCWQCQCTTVTTGCLSPIVIIISPVVVNFAVAVSTCHNSCCPALWLHHDVDVAPASCLHFCSASLLSYCCHLLSNAQTTVLPPCYKRQSMIVEFL